MSLKSWFACRPVNVYARLTSATQSVSLRLSVSSWRRADSSACRNSSLYLAASATQIISSFLAALWYSAFFNDQFILFCSHSFFWSVSLHHLINRTPCGWTRRGKPLRLLSTKSFVLRKPRGIAMTLRSRPTPSGYDAGLSGAGTSFSALPPHFWSLSSMSHC